MFKTLVSLVFLLLSTLPVLSQDFSVITFERKGTQYAHYNGTMTVEGMSALFTVIETASIEHLSINSPGGDTVAAKMLSSFINEHEISVLIDDFSICVSSCAFAIMASEKVISTNSDLYFHRPFFTYIHPDTTLAQIVEFSDEELISMIDLFVENGYNYQFFKAIYENTNQELFLRISVENLQNFRTGFTEEVLNPEQYYTIEGF